MLNLQALLISKSTTLYKSLVYFLIFAICAPFWLVPNTSHADFNDRCTAVGVIVCSGFDQSNDVDSFVYGDELGAFLGTYNTDQKSSGTGSMRFEIPGFTSANSSGGYERIIDEITSGYGPGDTLYIQYRQRFDTNMLNALMGGAGWKQSELTTTFGAYTDPVGIGMYNQDMANVAKMYIAGTTVSPSQNISYVANEWMTFYFRIVIGDWDAANSQVSAWVGRENLPLAQIYNLTNVVLVENDADPGSGLNKIILGPNNTGKSDLVDHPTAYTWYDELIISTSPIADPGADNQDPSVPTNLAGTANSATEVELTWTASTDNVGVTGYKIYRDSVELTTTALLTYTDVGLTAETTYAYQVSAYDAAGNESALTLEESVVTPAAGPPPDAENPTDPTNLAGTADSTSQITLTWTASTDNVGVTSYKIYRDNSEIATTANLTYSNTGLSASTQYSYKVKAFDLIGNSSGFSNEIQVTTQNAPSAGGGGGGGGGGVVYSLPVIGTFSISNSNIEVGQSATMEWSVQNATEVSIDQAVGTVSSTGSKLITPTQTTTYILRASNSAGQVTKSLTINVTPKQNTTQPYADGKLILDKGAIYVIEYGLKRPIASMEVFTGYGYNIQNVITADLQNVALGSPILSSALRHPRGTVVTDNKGTVWFMGAQQRIAFPSAEVFLSWGHKFEDIVPANSADLAITNVITAELKSGSGGSPNVPTATRHARGVVVIDSSGTVWFMGAQQRIAFPSAEVFLSWGHKFEDIVPANSADLAVPIGAIATRKQ